MWFIPNSSERHGDRNFILYTYVLVNVNGGGFSGILSIKLVYLFCVRIFLFLPFKSSLLRLFVYKKMQKRLFVYKKMQTVSLLLSKVQFMQLLVGGINMARRLANSKHRTKR